MQMPKFPTTENLIPVLQFLKKSCNNQTLLRLEILHTKSLPMGVEINKTLKPRL